jgi:hypothetical protein
MITVLNTQEDLARVAEILDFTRTDPVRIRIMEASNAVSMSEGYVAHGEAHAQDVFGLYNHITTQTERLFPGTFTPFFLATGAVGALMHDVGRSQGGIDHDKTGAVITNRYLKELALSKYGNAQGVPLAFRRRVVSNVRKHRSDSWLYKDDKEKARRKREIDGPDIAAILLADKLSGSETRVPQEKIDLLHQLSRIKVPRGFRRKHGLEKKWSFARINWNTTEPAYFDSPELVEACKAELAKIGFVLPTNVSISAHDRVNGSIASRSIEMFADEHVDDGNPETLNRKYKGTMVFNMKVDERLAPHDLVTGLDWWHDAFHVAAKAAKYLGFRFRIVFNGRNLVYDKNVDNWVFVNKFESR